MHKGVVPSLCGITSFRFGMNFLICTEKTPCEMMTINDITEWVR